MHFAFTDEQLALGATVRDVLRAHCPPGALRTERRPAWDQLAELGFFGLLLPPELDGLGLGLTDVLPAVEETGRACLPGPVVQTAVAAAFLVPRVPKLASGAVCVGVLLPGETYAADADLADVLVVARTGSAARVFPGHAARLAARPGVDPCRPLFDVAVEPSGQDDLAAPGADRVALAARAVTVATAAQLVGVARELLAVSVSYARVRRQFGAAIGSFQAVRHKLADVAVAVEFAAPLVHRAALSVDRSAPTAERDVSAAKAAAGEAATLAARVALQTHGAIGYTEELDLRFWLARAWSLLAAYGGAALHRERVRASLLGGDLRRNP
ncbi:acyl-CoA dehydrogenase family protein [Nonomuraea spiralis]|uniref:Acyl-CoA dehydrogenase family protein n=1 Tax=Nonomuraea spiralis TaxID=46182 RepID=A0ABV5IMP0_9ACTN|nr:acyl-CoA dehydrogenase family protein [Nonomuraea spiralis]